MASCMFALIKWVEDPPTWDIVPIEYVLTKSEIIIGGVYDTKYRSGTSPAEVLSLSKFFKVHMIVIIIL
jgi:hypothetical protein